MSVHTPYNEIMSITANKDSRFEMRLTQEQRDRIDEAAAINGASASQWALSNLLEAADRDIREARTIRLDDASWHEFVASLDDPMPDSLKALLRTEPIWR